MVGSRSGSNGGWAIPHCQDERRTDAAGVFSNERAVSRLLGGILAEQHDEGALARRYVSAKTLAEPASCRQVNGAFGVSPTVPTMSVSLRSRRYATVHGQSDTEDRVARGLRRQPPAGFPSVGEPDSGRSPALFEPNAVEDESSSSSRCVSYEPGAAYTSVELLFVGVRSVGDRTDLIARQDGWVVKLPSAQLVFA